MEGTKHHPLSWEWWAEVWSELGHKARVVGGAATLKMVAYLLVLPLGRVWEEGEPKPESDV
jgi:hypothetical protein